MKGFSVLVVVFILCVSVISVALGNNTANSVSLGVFPQGNTIGHKYLDGVLFAPMDMGVVAEITGIKLLKGELVVRSWETGQSFPRGIAMGTFDWTGLYLKDAWFSVYFADMKDVELVITYILYPGVDAAELWFIASNLVRDEQTIWLTPRGGEIRQVVWAELAPAQKSAIDQVMAERKERFKALEEALNGKLATTWAKIKTR